MTAQPDDFDDDVDLVAVERACSGDHSVALNRAEVAAAFHRLADRDYDNRQIADRLGVDIDTVNSWRRGLRRPIGLKAGRAMTTSHDDALFRADGITDRKIQNAAAKARTALDTLVQLLDEWDRKAEARAEVERLEEELAEARAKLRGYPKPKRIGTPSDESLACRKCGKECANRAGLSMHERHCKGIAA